ncbi:MAG: ADP-ribosylglycohydrolase family protein [Candidatus Auribacterota bacterium]|nr:ADP-ribosylglycohydrolase family protein [Candidatus Auribacterota bacterium]
MLNHFRGCLAGIQSGDALGMPVQGWLYLDIMDQYGVLDSMEKGILFKGDYTDETEMAIAVAESLGKEEGFNGESIAESLLAYCNPKRGYTVVALKAMESLRAGYSWLECAEASPVRDISYGSEAASRVAPLALLYHDQLEKLWSNTVLSSRITNVHPMAVEAAKWQAHAIAHVLYHITVSKDIDPIAFCDYMEAKIEHVDYLKKLKTIRKFLASPPPVSQVISQLGNNSEALHCVPTALYAFLLHPGDFESAVVYAVNLGGNSDTLGALTGALSGTYCGFDAIPDRWVRNLKDNAHNAVQVAGKLYKVWRNSHTFNTVNISLK